MKEIVLCREGDLRLRDFAQLQRDGYSMEFDKHNNVTILMRDLPCIN